MPLVCFTKRKLWKSDCIVAIIFYENDLYFFTGNNGVIATLHNVAQKIPETAETFPVPSSANFLTNSEILLS